MTSDDIVKALIGALEATSIPYMIVGSYSSNYYGIPRSTKDVDLVIQVGEQSIAELAASLGPDFRVDPQASFEMATLTTRNIAHAVGNDFKIELFHLSDDEHDQERFRRRKRVVFPDCSPFLPAVEDVIIMKLRWLDRAKRAKDRDDVLQVIAVQNDHIDWGYVHSWCDRHGTRELLDEIRKTLLGL